MNQLHDKRVYHWLGVATALMLVLAFAFGGSSQERDWGTAVIQLFALPPLIMITWLAWSVPRGHRIALAALVLIFAGVAAQLLPFPVGIDGNNGVHRSLQDVLSTAGVDRSDLRVSLDPWATERGLLVLLPAIAAFGSGLLLPLRRKLQLSWLLVGLICANLVFGLLTLGAPRDSPLNLFPQFPPSVGGVLANPNHQGTALVIALVIAMSWLLGRWEVGRAGPHANGTGVPIIWRKWGAGVLGAVLLAAVPLTGSRAMVLIGAGALLAVPVTSGWLRAQLSAGRRKRIFAVAACVLLGVASVVFAASNWMRVDNEAESRGAFARATAALAVDAMPTGTGVGSFVSWFDAHMPDALLEYSYINHAHNEYLQWWLESGASGLVWIALLIFVMVWAYPFAAFPTFGARVSPERAASRSVDGPAHDLRWLTGAAWLAVAVLLAHSVVDYPLRTLALLTAGAWFAGVMVSGALQPAIALETRRVARG